MTISSSLRRVLDRKQWEMCAPAPVASTAGSFVVSSLLDDQHQLYIPALATPYMYHPDQDAWQLLPTAAGIAGTFGAGSCGCYHPSGPTGTATAGSTTTITTNLTIPGSLAGYKVRITAGPNAGEERTIASNTYGANSVITVTSAFGTAITTSSVYLLLTGRFWVFVGNNATQGLGYYDVATNAWTAGRSVTGIPATFATDGKLRATPGTAAGYAAFSTGTASAGAATTLTDATKSWATNQWTNAQVRISSGLGAGQVRTIASNTATVLTVSAAWATNPDATSVYVLEGNDDFIYLAGNNNVAMYRYSITGNAWTTLAPGVARAAAPGAGMSLQWIRSVPEASWSGESAIRNGRYLYSFQGAATALGPLHRYDIAANTWETVAYLRSGEAFGAGSAWDNGGNGLLFGHKDSTSRYFVFDVEAQTMDALSVLPYPQGTALVGDRMFTADYTDGGTTLTYLYHLRNSGTELFRCLIF